MIFSIFVVLTVITTINFIIYLFIFVCPGFPKTTFTSETNCKFRGSVQFMNWHSSVVSDSLWPHESQHARPPCPSPSSGVLRLKTKTSLSPRTFFNHSFPKRPHESRSVLSDSLQPHGLYSPWNSPGQNTGLGSLFLLQGIFPTQGLNSGLPHCRQIL